MQNETRIDVQRNIATNEIYCMATQKRVTSREKIFREDTRCRHALTNAGTNAENVKKLHVTPVTSTNHRAQVGSAGRKPSCKIMVR